MLKVKELIDILEKMPADMRVFMQKQNHIGTVSGVCTVVTTYHPLSGVPCALIVDGEEEEQRPHDAISNAVSTPTVRELIAILKTYNEDLEVMLKPSPRYSYFDDIWRLKQSSYGFFGMDIPCVLLCGE